MRYIFLMLSFAGAVCAQDAEVAGFVRDPSSAVVINARVEIKNVDTGAERTSATNDAGLYAIPALPPGSYTMTVQASGFQTTVREGIRLEVAQNARIDFTLEVGTTQQTVTVQADASMINTTDASVSTVVDRQFVENMPLNGRSLQDLMTLAPGVMQVPVSSTLTTVGASGEITVNGQRTEANNFTVDGVSANTGTWAFSSIGGSGFSGSVPGQTVLGTTQTMVSIDALQEFRVSTSTYSAEYGRTPGGQFSFISRSGTNVWHGSAFDYFRNEALDGNNWFNNAAVPHVQRLPERQNDFGGTLGGPLQIPKIYNGKNRTFFFFSYEGLRLTIPQPFQQYYVPDATLRHNAPAALQPFLAAFPAANGGEDGFGDGLAYYNFAYSSPSSIDSSSIRVDHNLNDKLKLFGRYASTPSNSWTYYVPAFRQNTDISVRSLTLGATSIFSPAQTNEFHFNLTQNNMSYAITSTDLGGATPLTFDLFPGPPESLGGVGTSATLVLFFGGREAYWVASKNTNAQRQFNITDTYSWSPRSHHFRFGADWRRVATYVRPLADEEEGEFLSSSALIANTANFAFSYSTTSMPVEPAYHNFSAFVTDEWKATKRLSLSLGLRWDINPPPSNALGPAPYTVNQITNLATTQLAPLGTALWKTDWHGFGPRTGLAYSVRNVPGKETILRVGAGLFYDLGSNQGSAGFNGVGYSSLATYSGLPFPLDAAHATPPVPSLTPPYNGNVYAFDPNLKLPRTWQWNVALEQGLGSKQTLTINYVGAAGRRLLADCQYLPSTLGNPNFAPNVGFLTITSNRASSDYDALQLRYDRQLSHGLQVLASYSWAHSIDDASNNGPLRDVLFRASSDFDIRHDLSTALTYNFPERYWNRLISRFLGRWSLDTRVSARSALPVDIVGSTRPTTSPGNGQYQFFYPNLVPGQSIYVYGSQYPSGRIINYNAFSPAPAGQDGNVGRNFARALDAVQTNLALRRDFPLGERLHLQFRVEAFNLFNHPLFGLIYNQLSRGPSQFGYAYTTLNNSSAGGLNPLYSIGGPRSIQLALKLVF